MNNEIAIRRKLDAINALTADIALLLSGAGEIKPRIDLPAWRLEINDLVARSYPKDGGPMRRITCASVCTEIGIEPNRSNCTSVGQALKAAGFNSRRSNGITLHILPPMQETF